MNESVNHGIGLPSQKTLTDEYGNLHYPADELARGGQGVVFHTKDADLAIKQPLDASGNVDKSVNMHQLFQSIRLLPLPSGISISLPVAILRDEPGYVMRLLSGMKPFSSFDLNGNTMNRLRDSISSNELELPKWLSEVSDEKVALRLFHYANTGSTRRRLLALSKCASILGRLHSAGLVYSDISHNNVYIDGSDNCDVWLIDSDNLRFEEYEGGNAVFTPHYGAPEVVQGLDKSRPRTDCWSFAVMSFRILALCHPFIGKRVLAPEDDGGGWDAEPEEDGAQVDLDEQAYAGLLPFIDDENDKTNSPVSFALPRELVASPEIRQLFQESFGPGRIQPYRRPLMPFWACELARAYDRFLDCSGCRMSYLAHEFEKCPYCGAPRPGFLRVKTDRWEAISPVDAKEFSLRHRLFNPFSLENNDDVEYEAVVNFETNSVEPVRGTKPFPESVSFEFIKRMK